MNLSVCLLKYMQPFRLYTVYRYICVHTNGLLAPFVRVISSALLFFCSCVHTCVESVLQVCEACCLSPSLTYLFSSLDTDEVYKSLFACLLYAFLSNQSSFSWNNFTLLDPLLKLFSQHSWNKAQCDDTGEEGWTWHSEVLTNQKGPSPSGRWDDVFLELQVTEPGDTGDTAKRAGWFYGSPIGWKAWNKDFHLMSQRIN